MVQEIMSFIVGKRVICSLSAGRHYERLRVVGTMAARSREVMKLLYFTEARELQEEQKKWALVAARSMAEGKRHVFPPIYL
ncbi:hypothetical protein M422DRAFT_239776 [Sphaerobolus stellatus SS14]|nr:hypothetical protein M422DRAFT_239776 [Sphaerobolus stellatus SS14]